MKFVTKVLHCYAHIWAKKVLPSKEASQTGNLKQASQAGDTNTQKSPCQIRKKVVLHEFSWDLNDMPDDSKPQAFKISSHWHLNDTKKIIRVN